MIVLEISFGKSGFALGFPTEEAAREFCENKEITHTLPDGFVYTYPK